MENGAPDGLDPMIAYTRASFSGSKLSISRTTLDFVSLSKIFPSC